MKRKHKGLTRLLSAGLSLALLTTLLPGALAASHTLDGYEVDAGKTIKINANDFNSYCKDMTEDGETMYSIYFSDLPSSRDGELYYLDSDNEKIEEVISEGYKQIGVPYVYGAVRLHDGYGNKLKGFTKAKFDCSSLVQYVFHEGADVLLQTTTRTQVKQGKFVPRSELSRGDCIYFTNSIRQNNTGVERIGHVAIYLGGNYILHTATDYARIEQISSTRWSYYIETRRFV